MAHPTYLDRIRGEELARHPELAQTVDGNWGWDQLKLRLIAEIETASHIFALSEFHSRTFVEAGVPDSKLVSLPLGVDLDLFSPGARDVRDGGLRVGMVGRLGQLKGLSYLIEGFQRAAIPNSMLQLIGSPQGSDHAWKGVRGIEHIPWRPRRGLPGVYRDLDVLVHPSLAEGFSLVVLEAMACGTPVIVSTNTYGDDGGGVVEDGVSGYVIPIRDSTAIAERLRHLNDHPDVRTEMGAAARQRAESFSWDQFEERIGEIVQASF
jgi:glycosyltransferase involved in cell wall biosynthesis